MRVKINDLSDVRLNYWTARAQGWHQEILSVTGVAAWFDEKGRFTHCVRDYDPVSEWAYGGPLVDRFGVYLGPCSRPERGIYFAHLRTLKIRGAYGFDALQAICRVVIRSVYGDFVNDPDSEFST